MAAISKANIVDFQSRVLSWYFQTGRKFPWREKMLSSYQLIIAECMLQRTKAETVAQFYNNFLNLYPTWLAIADCDVTELEHVLKPIGLYRQRAKRLKALAEEMVKRKGIIPSTRSDLESIPFFGQYMTNAVLLLVHDLRLPLIDVNMARVLERYFSKRELADIRYDPKLQRLSHRIAQHENSKELNWAILDFAALVCTARNPKCDTCFFKKKCTFFNVAKRY